MYEICISICAPFTHFKVCISSLGLWKTKQKTSLTRKPDPTHSGSCGLSWPDWSIYAFWRVGCVYGLKFYNLFITRPNLSICWIYLPHLILIFSLTRNTWFLFLLIEYDENHLQNITNAKSLPTRQSTQLDELKLVKKY